MFRCFGDRLRSPYSDHPDHMRDALTESRVDAKMTDVAFVRHLRQSPYWQTLSNRAQLRVLNRCLVSAIDLYSQVVRVQDAVFADIEVLVENLLAYRTYAVLVTRCAIVTELKHQIYKTTGARTC